MIRVPLARVADDVVTLLRRFDPSQPRDAQGQWTETLTNKLNDMLGDGEVNVMDLSDVDDDGESDYGRYMEWSAELPGPDAGVRLDAFDRDDSEEELRVDIYSGHLRAMVAEMSKSFVRNDSDDPLMGLVLADPNDAIRLDDDGEQDGAYIDWSSKHPDGGRGIEIGDGDSTRYFKLTGEQFRQWYAGLALTSLKGRSP